MKGLPTKKVEVNHENPWDTKTDLEMRVDRLEEVSMMTMRAILLDDDGEVKDKFADLYDEFAQKHGWEIEL